MGIANDTIRIVTPDPQAVSNFCGSEMGLEVTPAPFHFRLADSTSITRFAQAVAVLEQPPHYPLCIVNES